MMRRNNQSENQFFKMNPKQRPSQARFFFCVGMLLGVSLTALLVHIGLTLSWLQSQLRDTKLAGVGFHLQMLRDKQCGGGESPTARVATIYVFLLLLDLQL